MNIKNYTSSVPVINSINRIEHRLSQAGATHIAKTYDKERPVGMLFQITVNGNPMTFRLPAKTEKVYEYLIKQRKNPPTESMKESIKAQADRTSWKILSDWIDIQVSIIQLDQAEPIEVFLPYHFNPNTQQTLFESLAKTNFKMLNA